MTGVNINIVKSKLHRLALSVSIAVILQELGMSRRNEIYVSGDVFKSLLLLAKAQSGDIEAERRVTADEIADQILRQAIREQHPQLLEYKKRLDKLEQETIESLRPK